VVIFLLVTHINFLNATKWNPSCTFPLKCMFVSTYSVHCVCVAHCKFAYSHFERHQSVIYNLLHHRKYKKKLQIVNCVPRSKRRTLHLQMIYYHLLFQLSLVYICVMWLLRSGNFFHQQQYHSNCIEYKRNKKIIYFPGRNAFVKIFELHWWNDECCCWWKPADGKESHWWQ
jgi:hypothetical protein